jgi:hypothetical protein
MKHFTINAFLESALPLPNFKKWWSMSEDLFSELINIGDIFQLSRELVHSSNFELYVSGINEPFCEIEEIIKNRPSARLRKYIKIRAKIIPNKNIIGEIQENLKEFSIGECENIYFSEVILEIEKFILDLILASNIAKPGSLSVSKIYFFKDSEFFEEKQGLYGDHLDIYPEIRETNVWPQIQSIPVWKVMTWLMKLPGFEDAIGQCRVGRAVSSLSYVLKEKPMVDDTPNLIWAMLGLEALYGEGGRPVQKELIEKIETFLGKNQSHKKSFSHLYDFRSRFVHGDINFPYSYSFSDTHLDYEKFRLRKTSNSILALSILLSTIQKLVDNNWFDLNFKYVVSEK